NCGRCGKACGGGEICVDGLCTASCVEPLQDCDNVCVDVKVDPANCGGCGQTCGPYAGAVGLCRDASCDLVCDQDRGNCNDFLLDGCEADFLTDSQHCGACGKACNADQRCIDGVCGNRVQPCDVGNDPGTNAAYVVCEVDLQGGTAWLSANASGRYHAELICQELGYAR